MSNISRRLPGGRWTVLRFPSGTDPAVLGEVVVEAVAFRKAHRPERSRWVALLGETWMAEGQPVLLLSPSLAGEVGPYLQDAFEVLGPAEVRRLRRRELAFTGDVLAWLEPGVEVLRLP